MRRVVDRFLEHPLVYRWWQAPFVESKFLPVRRRIGDRPTGRVLDVGCGPGTNARWFKDADYTGLDINERYLSQARSRHAGRFIQADLATADLTLLGSFDIILINSFLHHLSDAGVAKVLSQAAARLEPNGRVHILELVVPAKPAVATIMAKLDRGRYARTIQSWCEHFERYFEPAVVEPYTVGRGLWAMLYFQGRRGKTDLKGIQVTDFVLKP